MSNGTTDYDAELRDMVGLDLVDTTQTLPELPMPPCASLLLAGWKDDPEIEALFDEYFFEGFHEFLAEQVFSCSQNLQTGKSVDAKNACLPPSCITLGGWRGSATYIGTKPSTMTPAPDPVTGAVTIAPIRRVFIADLAWLYLMEEMGILRLFAILVNDFAIRGCFPISIFGSDTTAPNKELSGVTLEVMVRQLELGMASSVRDRESSYRRCLGWAGGTGKRLNVGSEIGTAFNEQLVKLVQLALTYYEDKRLAKAIQLSTTGFTSAATEIAITETLVELKQTFQTFDYGRNHYNTINGILYVIATLNLLQHIKSEIGIPSTYTKASDYVPAAYYKLLEGKDATSSRPNRYISYLTCAKAIRHILLDVEKLNTDDQTEVGTWIDNENVEENFEVYRKTYKDIYKRDLLKDIDNVEQKAA